MVLFILIIFHDTIFMPTQSSLDTFLVYKEELELIVQGYNDTSFQID